MPQAFPRIVLHVDMDSFFAACEEKANPSLKGKPVVVGADPKGGKGRGVVSTANYAARKFGIRSAMPISRAFKLCPECVYLPVNFALYNKYSLQVMQILKRHAVKFEQWGTDEAFIELTGKAKDFAEAGIEAGEIKREIFAETGLTASVGVGPNKIVAKIASDYKKPDGLTLVRPDEARAFLSPLPVRKLLWVGKKTDEALEKLGITTIGGLASADPGMLYENFGKTGPALRLLAQGIDESPLVESWEAKSVGAQTTFEEDESAPEAVLERMEELCENVFRRFLLEDALYRTVTVTVRFAGFVTHTKAKSFREPTASLDVLKRAARELLAPFLETGKPVRLVGVRVSGFASAKGQTKLKEFR
ncbi:DNA polymerase IV [uncultured archaeon]|nr:DNA polymerase IV [uncultured archaeon]